MNSTHPLFSLVFYAVLSLMVFMASNGNAQSNIQKQTAEQWGKLVLKGVDTEFPNKLSLVYSNPNQIKTPREHFPAFYGCFDWHSSVHGHWVLVRLLKHHPDIESAKQIRSTLMDHLSPENLEREADFFRQDENKTFERMYGWAWFLRLVIELEEWDDQDGKTWRENLRPLEEVLASRIKSYLPRLQYPIRIGQHTDTGFALGQIIDYCRITKQHELRVITETRARAFYLADRAYPVHYEPSGHDFFSSCWNEADLMRRVLGPADFEPWFSQFLPDLSRQLSDGTISPVSVSDVTDPKIVHLAGLNLNRAWCMQSVASKLPEKHPVRAKLTASAEAHLKAGLTYINSGHYEGDHWLATFGLYAADRVGVVDAGK